MTVVVDNVLDQLKTLSLTLSPEGQPVPVAAYIYPDDILTMDLSSLPIVLVSEVVNETNTWYYGQQGCHFYRNWQAELYLLLSEGQIQSNTQAAIAEPLHRAWTAALAVMLKDNPTLNDAVIQIGDYGISGNQNQVLFQESVHHLAVNTRIFWGIRCVIPVRTL